MMSYKVELPALDQGWIFRARRIQLGKTLDELAAEARVGRNTLRRLEQGLPVELCSLQRIRRHLKLTQEQALVMLAIQRQQTKGQQGKPPEEPNGGDSP